MYVDLYIMSKVTTSLEESKWKVYFLGRFLLDEVCTDMYEQGHAQNALPSLDVEFKGGQWQASWKHKNSDLKLNVS